MNNKNIYIYTIIVATLVATIIWICIPKRYTAQTKIADEYKETDLAVGLDKISAHLKEINNKDNTGINDIEVYCHMLKGNDFAKKISEKKLSKSQLTYGEYLKVKDPIEEIKSNIEYNLSTKEQALTIQFKDKNPYIASEILDSITSELQNTITQSRHKLANSILKDALKEEKKSYNTYKAALISKAKYADSHQNIETEQENQEYTYLDNETKDAFAQFEKAQDKRIRQEMLCKRAYCSFAIIKKNVVPTDFDSNILSYIFAFNAISIIFIFILREYIKVRNRIRYVQGDVFSPWVLTVGIWGVNLSLYFLQSDTLYPIQQKFWNCLIVWIPLFLITSIISATISNSATATFEESNKNIFNKQVFNILWAISMILSPLYLYKVMKIVLQFSTTDLLYNIRMLAVSGEAGSLLLNSVQAINLALFICAVWHFSDVSKLKFIAIIIANFVVEFAMMEKSGILVMILSTLFVLHQKKRIKVRTIGITLGLTIVLFFLINSSKESQHQESTTFLEFFGMYVTSPAVAFGYLNEDLNQYFGINTFSQIYQYLNAFGFNFRYITRIQEFVYVPVPTNVYTIFQPFYEDFGVTGVGVFACIYGFIFGWIYGKYKAGNSYCKLLYTYCVEIIIIQFYNENFLQNLFMSVGIIVWTFLLTQRTIILEKSKYDGKNIN